MNKQEIVQLLVKNLKKMVPEFADEEIDLDKTYQNLGVSSLELVEIVTRTAKEMGLNLPMAALAAVRTTNDLANLLVRFAGEQKIQ
jgi:acyl carrier protein